MSESRATESRASGPPACELQKRSSGGPGGRISVLLKRSSGVLGALGRIAVLLKRSRRSGALERDGSITCSLCQGRADFSRERL